MKKFQIKEGYSVDLFAAFGITGAAEISLTIFVII